MHTINRSTNWKGKLFWHVNSCLSKLKSQATKATLVSFMTPTQTRLRNHVYHFQPFWWRFCEETFQIISQFPLPLSMKRVTEWHQNERVSISPTHKAVWLSHFRRNDLRKVGKFICRQKAKCIKENDCQSFSRMKNRLKNECERKHNFYHHVRDANKKIQWNM